MNRLGHIPPRESFSDILDCHICNQVKPIIEYSKADIKHIKHHIMNQNGVPFGQRMNGEIKRHFGYLPIGDIRVEFD